jgi:hypothetical protein
MSLGAITLDLLTVLVDMSYYYSQLIPIVPIIMYLLILMI